MEDKLPGSDFTPQQRQSLIKLISTNIINWASRNLVNIHLLISHSFVTGDTVQLENQARVVIDWINGIIVYDQQNNILAQIKLDQVSGATATPLYLRNNGSLKQVLWDGTQLHF